MKKHFEKQWWKEAVGYQIYPKSFKDSNNDGIGDIKGIEEKIPYLNELGINLIWIGPFYKSPMDDNGYDVSDFKDVDPTFGTIDDMKSLIKTCKTYNIKIIIDLVLNHTSDEHPWFVESKKSTDNPYRDYYIWKDGRVNGLGEEIEPTNWASFFGGSCWKKDEQTNQYYMKIFSDKMPDLNWSNKKVRKSMYDIATYWLDLGIDGFRVDAVSHLGREGFIDSKNSNDRYVYAPENFSNLPILHTYIKEFRQEVLDHYDIVTVGELGGGPSIEDGINYAGYESNEFNMAFNFDHNWVFNENGIDVVRLKTVFKKWQVDFFKKGWNPLYWLNHDHPRVISHYGDPSNHKLSGSMLATVMYFMWGTPFIYNGEEIGMTNYPFSSLDDFSDIAIKTTYKARLKTQPNLSTDTFINDVKESSRDNARTPIQWSDDVYGGFSNVEPWFHINPNYKEINVKRQKNDPDSLWSYYKNIIDLRRNSKYKDVIVYGETMFVDQKNEHIFSFIRSYEETTILIVANMHNVNAKLDYDFKVKDVLIHNIDSNITENLKPYEAYVVKIK
jgi:oligo-1,6-glucosidase